MSETPRTDCNEAIWSDTIPPNHLPSVDAEFCRKLERELTHAKADAASWAQQAEDRLQDALRIAKERDDALNRVKRLEEAVDLASKMWIDWVDNRNEDGCSGAYYAFVKHHHDEWDVIMKAVEAKP